MFGILLKKWKLNLKEEVKQNGRKSRKIE